MRGKRFAMSFGTAALVLFSSAALSQQPAAAGQAQPVVATGGVISSLLAAPVLGQPFSAIQQHSTIQTLADGTTIAHHGHHSIARDAEGRVHVELRMAKGVDGKPDEIMVFLVDPVAHTLTTWMANAPGQIKQAAVIKLPAAGMRPTEQPYSIAASTADSRPEPVITVEDLGTQSIEGVEVTGKRTTTIVPKGRSGNSAPITRVHEVWTSSELQLVIKQHWSDPRTGEQTVELKNLARTNPDVALFHPPAGYEVRSVAETLKQLEDKLSTAQ